MSRRIPISSTSQSNQNNINKNNQQQQGIGGNQNNQNNNNGNGTNKNWQTSSLDIVFSFSRSQAFFGSNLPSSPSFVARYRRPAEYRDEEELEGEESSQLTTTDREHSGNRSGEGDTRTGSEDREESIATTDESWSEDELDQNGIQSWERSEVLPRNAVISIHDTSQRNRIRRQESSEGGSPVPESIENIDSEVVPSEGGENVRGGNYGLNSINNSTNVSPSLPYTRPTERTHLLVPRVSTTFTPPNFQSFSPESNSNPKNNPKHNLNYRHQPPPRDRRFSIISGETWEEAIEEQRGKSTYGQTLFNCVNVLVGVGLLAEPLAFADAGWIAGTFLLLFCALITCYTAKILARIMARDNSLETYSDVLVKAFGPGARTFIHSMFVLELGAFGIALIVLFSDSMSTLFPSWDTTSFKLLAFVIILPTTFLPLRFLSITSLIGILSSFTLLFVLIADGTIKHHSPGSLWEPMKTSIEPRWSRVPLSLGLFMSGFSGHAVIPSLVRDMKDPRQFNSMINVAYIIAFTISILMGVVGYCMFGNDVSSEITRDMLLARGYPAVLNKVAMWMIAINPVVKYALISRALSSTLEHLLGINTPSHFNTLSTLATRNPSVVSILSNLSTNNLEVEEDTSAIHSEDSSSSVSPLNPFVPPNTQLSNSTTTIPTTTTDSTKKSIIHTLISPMLLGLIILLAILIPDFGRVLSFLGSSSAFLICCIGPLIALLILGNPLPKGSALEESNTGGGGGNRSSSSQGINNGVEIESRGRKSFRKKYNSNGEERISLLPKGIKVEGIWIVSQFERGINWILLLISIGFCLVGTIWTVAYPSTV